VKDVWKIDPKYVRDGLLTHALFGVEMNMTRADHITFTCGIVDGSRKNNLPAMSKDKPKSKILKRVFTVNLSHDGVFVPIPVKYLQGDVKQVTNMDFEGMSFEDLTEIVRRYDVMDYLNYENVQQEDSESSIDEYYSDDGKEIDYADFSINVNGSGVGSGKTPVLSLTRRPSKKWTRKLILEDKKTPFPFRWITTQCAREILKDPFILLRNMKEDIRQKYMIDSFPDVVSDWLPYAEKMKCTKHVYANCKDMFSGVQLQRMF
ncbi:hypothetical protein Tco_1260124, partial [Tanacetum coccineum]